MIKLFTARFTSATVEFRESVERKLFSEVAFMENSGEPWRVLWVAFEMSAHDKFHVWAKLGEIPSPELMVTMLACRLAVWLIKS